MTLTAGKMSAYSGTDDFDLDNTTTAPPIPEPETYALMLTGLGLLGWATRRRLH